jgi:hypothetical protein
MKVIRAGGATESAALMIRVGSRIHRVIGRDLGDIERDFSDAADRLESIHLDRLAELTWSMSAMAKKTGMGGGEDAAPLIAMQLWAGWLQAKLIARRSRHTRVIATARVVADLYLDNIRRLLRAL